MLNPRIGRGKAALRVLVPNKLATIRFGVRHGGDEILAAIFVHVDPVSHMVEVAIGVASHGLSFSRFSYISLIHGDQIKTSVGMSGHKEAVGDDNGAFGVGEHIIRDDLNIVRPLERADVFDFN